ncbi:lipopolysaccharide biosynthesis protein [Streptomyces sp. NPDC058572]|uniref:lipopolysaccharide biosynthesis protein n=1 Tax=Streptomyces sp. NPDC058572 TaxID=3346546 RepID=UPI00366821C5
MPATAGAGVDDPAGPTGAEAAVGPTPGGSGDSLFRNAYALMLSTGVSAALGLGFWLVAARYYSQQAVGEGSAAIAAMRLLASLTATTMIGAVVRYVPRAGRATGALVWRAYAGSSVVVCLACMVFLFTLDLWGPSFVPLRGITAGLVFTAACVGWALLTLQDGVLTGLRRAVWVPVGNAVFSLGKLLLLAVLAGVLPVLGIFVSWAAAIALSVLPLGWLVFRRLIPRQAAADHDREPPRSRDIGRFLAGDSVGALFSLAMINLLPVMVAVRFDAAHNGFFYIAYTVGGTMEFMAINMASSLTAHASHSPGTLAAGVRGALRRMALLLVPVVLFLVVLAPQILAPFGEEYAEHGTTVLRLLAAAALPRVVVELCIGVLRVQGRTGMLAALQGVMCALVLGSAALLLGPTGIDGAGWAVLLSMTVTALLCAPSLRTALTGRAAPQPVEYGTAWARRAAEHHGEAARHGRQDHGTDRARETSRPRGAHEGTAGPASGIPVRVAASPGRAVAAEVRPGEDAPGAGDGSSAAEERAVTSMWLLLGVACGLFWAPLVQSADLAAADRVSGYELVRALPALTLGAGLLLLVVQSAALALLRPRGGLLAATVVVTFAALHTAPPLLGRPPEPGWLPVAYQFLCLAALSVILHIAGLRVRARWSVLWLLTLCGWALQQQVAPVALPLLVLLLCAASVLALLRRRRPTD